MTKASHDIRGKRNTAPWGSFRRSLELADIPVFDIPWRDDAKDKKPPPESTG